MKLPAKNQCLNIAILFSAASIIVTIFINYKIAQRYLRADGKTRALFGITELFQFGYQYYLAIPVTIAFIFALAAIRNNRQQGKLVFALLISLFAIVLVFVRCWRLMV